MQALWLLKQMRFMLGMTGWDQVQRLEKTSRERFNFIWQFCKRNALAWLPI